MFRFLKPTYRENTVFDIDFHKLYEEGIRLVIFDIDNTLISYDENLPDENLKTLFKELDVNNIKATILSNGHSERAKNFSSSLNIGFQGDAFKPNKKGYLTIVQNYNVNPSDCLMVGDQLFTDIWGANRFGCKSILVKPINLSNEPIFVKFKRLLEKLFLKEG